MQYNCNIAIVTITIIVVVNLVLWEQNFFAVVSMSIVTRGSTTSWLYYSFWDTGSVSLRYPCDVVSV